jgi:hypothetical protein
MLGFGRTVLPMNYVKVWAHGFAQQEGRTKEREYLVSWWCSSPAKVASSEVGQQRRSQGHRGCRGRTPCRRWSRGRWAPGGARPSAVSSPGCGAASGWRGSTAGETSPGGGPRVEQSYRKKKCHFVGGIYCCPVPLRILLSY